MDERDERKRTSGDASKRFKTASELELHHCSRKSVAGTYLLATRCPVYRRHDSHSGSRTELENLSNDAKGKGTSSEPARPKVPMRRAGADCSVIARKRGNARGAKGAGHRRWERANWQQEEPSFLDGRRRSSFGGTSRMMREYHVRICERLGVKLPGPTRQTADATANNGDPQLGFSPLRGGDFLVHRDLIGLRGLPSFTMLGSTVEGEPEPPQERESWRH